MAVYGWHSGPAASVTTIEASSGRRKLVSRLTWRGHAVISSTHYVVPARGRCGAARPTHDGQPEAGPSPAWAAELIELPASYRNDGKLSMEWEVAPATTEADRASTATCRAVAHHGPARTARTVTCRRRQHRAEAQPGQHRNGLRVGTPRGTRNGCRSGLGPGPGTDMTPSQ